MEERRCQVCGKVIKGTSEKQLYYSMKSHRKSDKHQFGERIRRLIDEGEIPDTKSLDDRKIV